MNKNITKILLVAAGAVWFNLVFWHEKLGLNTALYDLFILSALFTLFPQALRKTTVRWLLLAHLICVAMVVMHNTAVSKFGFITTLCLVVPFAEYAHRNVWYAGGSMLSNAVFMVATFGENLLGMKTGGVKRRPLSRIIRFSVFPLIILIVFFLIYSAANEAFSQLANRVGQVLQEFFGTFFDFFSPRRFLFFLLGLFITGAMLMKSRVNWFSQKDLAATDSMQRIRVTKKKTRRQTSPLVEAIMGRFAKGMLALKNENTTGIISLVLLNLLLLTVNIIDLDNIWFNFEYREDVTVKERVHDGTGLLITSIVLAMAILLFFFKGNLNFYRRNKWLKYGAYAWILQNVVLVISVGLRDYYYIAIHGLAYKRIGVLFFLLMVMIGLLTVFIKITHKKTGYYLWRVNAWAGIIILTISTTINWDQFILSYNLERQDKAALDVEYLLTLTDKALPMLYEHKAELQKAEAAIPRKMANRQCVTCVTEQLQKKKNIFFQQQSELSWLSWNYSDELTKKYFKQHP